MLLQWRVEGEKGRPRQCVKRYLTGGMGSGELERGIWGVENQSEGYGEWRTRARDMGSGELERGIWGVEN